MCKLPERTCEYEEESGRHNEAITVHREVVVDAMEEKVQCDGEAVVRQITMTLVSFIK